MNNKFNFAKFVLDCFACCGLTIISYFIFFLPIIYFIRFIYLIGINMDILNGFGDYALLFTLCHIAFFTIWFLLEKRNIIKYKIHKLSFWIVFAFANSFWWYLAYWLANRGFYK